MYEFCTMSSVYLWLVSLHMGGTNHTVAYEYVRVITPLWTLVRGVFYEKVRYSEEING